MEELNIKHLLEKLNEASADLESMNELRQETIDAVVQKRAEQAHKAMDKYAKSAALAKTAKERADKKELKAIKDAQPTFTAVATEMEKLVIDIKTKIDEDEIFDISEIQITKYNMLYFVVSPMSLEDADIMFVLREVGRIISEHESASKLDFEVHLTDENNILVQCVQVAKQDKELDTIIKEIKESKYQGPVGVDEIICNNLDKFSHQELVRIINTGYNMPGFNKLFPSGWHYSRKTDKYPVELAKAISVSSQEENITDIRNIFYRRQNKELFEDAAKVWKEAILKDVTGYENSYVRSLDDPQEMKIIYDEIAQEYPEFIKELYAAHSKEIAEKIKNA